MQLIHTSLFTKSKEFKNQIQHIYDWNYKNSTNIKNTCLTRVQHIFDLRHPFIIAHIKDVFNTCLTCAGLKNTCLTQEKLLTETRVEHLF